MLVFASGFVHSFSMEEQHAVVWFSTVCYQLQLWVAQRKYFWGWNFTRGTFFCTDELFRQNLLRLLQTMQNRKLCTDCERVACLQRVPSFSEGSFREEEEEVMQGVVLSSSEPMTKLSEIWRSCFSLWRQTVSILLLFLPLNNTQTVRRQL